jgi:MOSC domain-containing protein YiiM
MILQFPSALVEKTGESPAPPAFEFGYRQTMATRLVPAADYTTDDLLSTVRVLGPWWFCLTEHIKDPLGDPQISSLFARQGLALHELARACDLPTELFNIPLDDHELSLAASLLRKRIDDSRRTALEDCVDVSMGLIHEAAAQVRAIRREPTITSGTVVGLFSSGGGVPKQPIEFADVGLRGVAGDHQHTRKHHGRAWQALCIWSAEVVGRLAADGHPLAPGKAGENISISGLNWAEVLPGSQLKMGGVLCEISGYALPCSKNAQWFSDKDFERMHHRREVGISRVYASVIQTGTMTIGDTVHLS